MTACHSGFAVRRVKQQNKLLASVAVGAYAVRLLERQQVLRNSAKANITMLMAVSVVIPLKIINVYYGNRTGTVRRVLDFCEVFEQAAAV